MGGYRVPLRAVFYRESGRWVAHCLELDLLGDGDSTEDALSSLTDAIQLQVEATIEHKNFDNLFSPAEGKYFQMFAAGKDVAVGELNFVFSTPAVAIDGLEAREYDDEHSEEGCELTTA